MTSNQPRRMAFLLLEWFVHDNEALTGDLLEEGRERSATWLWRQVLFAVLGQAIVRVRIESAHDDRRHPGRDRPAGIARLSGRRGRHADDPPARPQRPGMGPDRPVSGVAAVCHRSVACCGRT